MTQRHRYIVPIVDRHTGQQSERTIEAVSAADAQAQMASDPTVFVGTARREDGTPEPRSSHEDHSAHLGFKPDQDDDAEPAPEPDRSTIDELSRRFEDDGSDRRMEDTLLDILAVSKLQSDRTAWIQRFLVWTVYGIPILIFGFIAMLSFLGSLARPDYGSPVAMFWAFVMLLCFASLMALLQGIHPTFGPRKQPFRPVRSGDEDLDRLRRRIETRRRARR